MESENFLTQEIKIKINKMENKKLRKKITKLEKLMIKFKDFSSKAFINR